MNLERLLNPRSIAVIGGTPAGRAIEQSIRLGYDGDIWAVHPDRTEMSGQAVVASLADLPGVPDAAFVAVNRDLTIQTVHELAAIGAGGAVLYASGFAEAGAAGEVLQDALTAGHDMPLIGPNCYGTINAKSGAAMWPDVHGCRRVESGPAFIGQSGNIALNMTMNRRGVDFAHVISLGNQASVSVEDCIAHLAADPTVSAIGLYLETVRDTTAFGSAAILAHQNQTPLVVLKSGRSATAETISASHTAAIATPTDAYDALFARYGVIVVHSLPDLMTTLAMLCTIGPLPGNRLVSLSCSGGEAALVADASLAHNVTFDPLTKEHRGRISSTLSKFVTVTNPLDYHTFIWGDTAALERCFTEVLTGQVDAGMLVLDWPDPANDDSDWWPTLTAIERASQSSGTPAIVVATLPESMPDRVRQHLADHGLGAAYSVEEALAGLARCAQAGLWFAATPTGLHHTSQPRPAAVTSLGEFESKALLALEGVTVPRGVTTTDVAAAAHLNFPVVAKVTGTDHKTETGGVVVGIRTVTELAAVLGTLSSPEEPCLVEEMVPDSVAELVVTVSRVPNIGVVATLGAGGTLVEVLNDTQSILLPATGAALEAALMELRTAALLTGHRGTPPADVDAVVGAIHAMDALMQRRSDIVEIEVNPLLATPRGAFAVDALVTIGGAQ